MARRILVLALALATGGCALAARDHACWPFVARHHHGDVPDALVRELARERGTRKERGGRAAPRGFYWRRAEAAPRGWELAPCPGSVAPRRLDGPASSRAP